MNAHKSTGLEQRLVAYSQTKPNDVDLIWDTATIKYSGDRLSYFNNLYMFYDLAYPEFSLFDFYFSLPIGILDNGDVWADSTKRWRRSYTTHVLNFFDETIKQFDNNDKLLSVNMHEHLANVHKRYEHVYDTQDRLVRSYQFNISTSTPDSSAIYFFEYDNSGNMVRDSIARRYNNQWVPGRSTFYTYNQNNDISAIDILTGQLDSEYHVMIIYDNLDRLFQVEISYNYGLYWEPQYQEFYAYQGNDPDFYTRQSMQWISGWEFYERYKKISNNNVTDTMQYSLYEGGFGWVKYYQTGYTYNLFGNVEQAFTTSFDLQGNELPANYSIHTYYYDQFFPTGMEQVPNSPQTLSYPNPAANSVVIDLENVVAADRITLYNAVGQSLINQQCGGKKETRLDLGELSPGLYYFIVTGKNGLKLSTGKIQKE